MADDPIDWKDAKVWAEHIAKVDPDSAWGNLCRAYLERDAQLATITAAKLCDEEVARMLAALPNKQTAGPFNRLAHTLVGKLAAMTAERDAKWNALNEACDHMKVLVVNLADEQERLAAMTAERDELTTSLAERDDDVGRYLRRGNHFAEAAKRYREMFRTAQAQLTASEAARNSAVKALTKTLRGLNRLIDENERTKNEET